MSSYGRIEGAGSGQTWRREGLRVVRDGPAEVLSRARIDPADVVELSRGAGGRTAEVRTELVERVRASIEAGTYETPERLEGAARALMSRLDVRG